MRRAFRVSLTLAALVAAGGGGYLAGQTNLILPAAAGRQAPPETGSSIRADAVPEPSGPVIYYRDPDGMPAYSSTPAKTADGRDFVPVLASEDVSFDMPAETGTVEPASAERKLLYYRHPMGLPDTSPVPKKDSMGMDYIPVYEGDESDGTTVKVAPGRVQNTGVRTELASERIVVRSIRIPGNVELDERLVSVVATRSEAFIDKVAEVTTGDGIEKGQPLLQLYSPQIAAAGAQFLSDLNTTIRRQNPAGSRQRLENLGVSDEIINEIERTGKVPLSMEWPAPRSGIVLQRNAVEGMMASPGETLFRVADISSVWVVANVPEYELGSVGIGASAKIRIRSLPGRVFEGRVTLIYPEVDMETRTTKVRIELPNPDGALLPQMYADVEIAAGHQDPVVAVPGNAVIDTGIRQVVIVDKGEGRFEPREVTIGARGDRFIEIRDGIAVGDRVVVAANFLIDAESNLTAAFSSLNAAEDQP